MWWARKCVRSPCATEFDSVAFTSSRTVESPSRHGDRVSPCHPVHHFRGFTFPFVETSFYWEARNIQRTLDGKLFSRSKFCTCGAKVFRFTIKSRLKLPVEKGVAFIPCLRILSFKVVTGI